MLNIKSIFFIRLTKIQTRGKDKIMQYRMKKYQLNEEQISRLLYKMQVASLATTNYDGTPYVTPVHFLYLNGHVYIHGLPAGKKIDNIKANPTVSLSVYEMDCLLLDSEGKPCDTNTKYQSVILQGTASLLTDIDTKETVLDGIVKKYTPHISNKTLPKNMVKGTAVIKISIEQVTGKYFG